MVEPLHPPKFTAWLSGGNGIQIDNEMSEYISISPRLCFSDLPRLALGGPRCNDTEYNVCLRLAELGGIVLLRLVVTLGVPFPWLVDCLGWGREGLI